MAFANHVSHRHCNKYDAKNNLSPFPLTDMVASDKCIRFYVIAFEIKKYLLILQYRSKERLSASKFSIPNRTTRFV